MSDLAADPRSLLLRSAPRLVSGAGRYVANLAPTGALSVVLVRSALAHARILGIDAAKARSLPGVVGVFVLSDLESWGVGELPIGWIVPGQKARANKVLAGGRVRHVGEPVAAVVAESPALAEDAAGLVEISYAPLPAVSDVEQALLPSAPVLHEEWGENVLARTSIDSGDAEQAFEEAAVVVADHFRMGRVACVPMEPCGATASYDALADEITLVSSTQSPHHVRAELAECFARRESSIRVIAPDVGGSFGAKDHASAAEVVVCVLALRLGRPVQWAEERMEHLASTGHSREQWFAVELAADETGRATGLRGRLLLDVGAYSTTHGMGTAMYALSLLPGPYRIPNYRLEALGVMTNKAPSGAYRGYGAPEAAFVIEGLMDRLARKLGLDPVEIRRRNLIPPGQFPFRSAGGLSYDQCDLPELLETAVSTSGYESHRVANPFARRRVGTCREGMGIACCVLMGGFGPSEASLAAGLRFGGYESARVLMDADGRATLFTGLPSQGQGLDTTLAQICAAELGLDPERDVTVVAGDTATTPYSPVGPIASRGIAVGGSVVHRASGKLAETLKRAAAEMMEAAEEDIELAGGRVAVRGVPGRDLPLAAVSTAVKQGRFQAQGIEPTLEVVTSFEPSDMTYSFAVHVAKVLLDVDTGHATATGYWAVSDCGVLVNPAVVRGQMTGGIVQGIGSALTEELVYGTDGQLLSGSLVDYGILSSAEVPPVGLLFFETPTSRTPTGARGAGELGIIGPAAAVANAVADALGPDVDFPAEVPLSPQRIWDLLGGRRDGGSVVDRLS